MRKWVIHLLMVGVLAGCGDDTESVSADECLSTQKWIGGNDGDSLMNPGQACNQCHRSDEGPIFRFAGTIFEDFTQKNNCFGIEGYVVELTDANGTVHRATSNAAGNFYSQNSQVVAPYTAIVRAPDGSERPMLTPQTDVDCNTCHGATGTQGAPGRIVVP